MRDNFSLEIRRSDVNCMTLRRRRDVDTDAWWNVNGRSQWFLSPVPSQRLAWRNHCPQGIIASPIYVYMVNQGIRDKQPV